MNKLFFSSLLAMNFLTACASVDTQSGQQGQNVDPKTYEECVEAIPEDPSLTTEELQRRVWTCQIEFGL